MFELVSSSHLEGDGIFKKFCGSVFDVNVDLLTRVREGMLNGDVDRNVPVGREFTLLCREIRHPFTHSENLKDGLEWMTPIQTQKLLGYATDAVVSDSVFVLG